MVTVSSEDDIASLSTASPPDVTLSRPGARRARVNQTQHAPVLLRHMPEHAERGMTSEIEVEEAGRTLTASRGMGTLSRQPVELNGRMCYRPTQ